MLLRLILVTLALPLCLSAPACEGDDGGDDRIDIIDQDALDGQVTATDVQLEVVD